MKTKLERIWRINLLSSITSYKHCTKFLTSYPALYMCIFSAIWLVPCYVLFLLTSILKTDLFSSTSLLYNLKYGLARRLLNIFLAIYAMTPGAVTFWSRCLYIYVTHSTSTTLESHNSEVFNVVFYDFIFFMYICSCISVVKPFPAK